MDKILPFGPYLFLPETNSDLEHPDGISYDLHKDKGILRLRKKDIVVTDSKSQDEVIIISDRDKLCYIPTLPDMAVVLRLNHSLIIHKGNSISTQVAIPMIPSLAIWSNKKKHELVKVLPVSQYSKTWFGDPVSGEPAYSLNSSLEIFEERTIHDYWSALCSLKIINDSPESLSFQRLILRIPFFSLFYSNEQFFTNRVVVRYRGMDQVSQLNLGSQNEMGDGFSLFSLPYLKRDILGLKRSFHFIKSLTTFER